MKPNMDLAREILLTIVSFTHHVIQDNIYIAIAVRIYIV